MELYQLESFIAVARAGSLSKAAVLRNISLSGISKHIKMLEEDLGVTLFSRNAKGMDLTDNGRLVLQHAETIRNSVNCLRILGKEPPPLRVGLNISPDFIGLSHLKSCLEQQYAEGKTVLINHNSSVLLDQLAEGELDICLAFGDVPSRFQKLFIRKVQMLLMIPTMQDDGGDLDKKCWIVNTAHCPFKSPLEEFWNVHAIEPQSTILAQDLSRKEIVAQGLGVGFLEPQDCLSLMQAGMARPHDAHYLEIPLWVVFKDPGFRLPAEFLQHYLQAKYDNLDDSALGRHLHSGRGRRHGRCLVFHPPDD